MGEESYQQIDASLLGAEHVKRYQENDGEVGYIWNGATTLLLTHTGRTSGKEHTTPLIFARDGDDLLIVASMGGAPMHPQWYLNVVEHPRVHVQIQGEHLDATARTASDDEKPRLWSIVTEQWPNYDVYQTRTDRVIPLVVLTPVSAGG